MTRLLNRWEEKWKEADSIFDQASEKLRLHGRIYSRWFEGYEEELVQRKGRRAQVIRRYTGNYYVPAQSHRRFVLRKAAEALLLAGALLLTIHAGIQDSAVNRSFAVVIFLSAYGLLEIWAAVAALWWLFAPSRLTVGDYRDGRLSLIRAAGRSSVAGIICAVAAAVFVLASHGSAADYLIAVEFGAAAGMSAISRKMEQRAEYRQEEQ